MHLPNSGLKRVGSWRESGISVLYLSGVTVPGEGAEVLSLGSAERKRPRRGCETGKNWDDLGSVSLEMVLQVTLYFGYNAAAVCTLFAGV